MNNLWNKIKVWWKEALIATGILGAAFAATLGASTDIEKIQDFQDRYYAQHGEYFQLREGQKLPTDAKPRMKNFAADNLKLNLSTTTDFRIDVHEYPDGTHGYTIRWFHPDVNIASST